MTKTINFAESAESKYSVESFEVEELEARLEQSDCYWGYDDEGRWGYNCPF